MTIKQTGSATSDPIPMATEPGLAAVLAEGGRHQCDYHPQNLCPSASQAPRLCDHCPELALHPDEG